MRVAVWDEKAKLARLAASKKSKAKKATVQVVPKVRKGTLLEVGDAVTTADKPVALFAGAVGYQKISARSAVRYVSFKPPALDPADKSEIEVEIMRGEIMHRTGKLAVGSIYLSRSGPRLAASAGTAYSVRAAGASIDVLVAEGDVSVSLTKAPSNVLTVRAREKATIGAVLPASALPVTLDDEPRIRELLSLPVASVIGYTDPNELTRANAEEIVTLRVRPALRIDKVSLASAEWRAMTVVVPDDTTFWTVDENKVRRETGRGLKFLDADRTGDAILAVDKDGNVWSLDMEGNRRFVASDFIKLDSFSPSGTLAVLDLKKWSSVGPNSDSGQGASRTVMRASVETYLVSTRYPNAQRIDFPVGGANNQEYVWCDDGRRLFALGHDQGVVTVVSPQNGNQGFVTPNILARTFLLSERGDWRLEFPNSGRWVVATRGSETRCIDADKGTAVTLQDVKTVEELRGWNSLLATHLDGRIDRVTRATGVFLMFGANPPPVVSPGAASDRAEVPGAGIAVSPNGELVTFRRGNTAIVADSLNFNRSSDTYVGIGAPYKCEWVSGDEVWYKDVIDKREEQILIKLGVKRRGARMSAFPGQSSPLMSLEAFTFDTTINYDELWVSDVALNGTVIGFVKVNKNPTQAFVMWPDQKGVAEALGNPQDPIEVVARTSDDGVVVGHTFAALPNGRMVYVPPGEQILDAFNGVSGTGLVLLKNNRIWDPRAEGVFYPVGEGLPYGGKVSDLRNVPDGAQAVAMNVKGQILYIAGPDTGHTFWIGLRDEVPVKGESTFESFGEQTLGDDGKVYVEQQSSDSARGPIKTQVTRYALTGPGVPLLRQPAVGEHELQGVTASGIVYGNRLRPFEGGQPGMMELGDMFLIVDGEYLEGSALLGSGYRIAIRRINANGAIAALIEKDGKPVLMVPNLNDLLKKR